MAVYDRWHTDEPRLVPSPRTGELVPVEPCKEHSRGKSKQYPSKDHLKGDRWQVRWRNDEGKQKKRNFELLGGASDEVDPERYAKAYDAQNTAALNRGDYTDPAKGKTLLEDYGREWLQAQTGEESSLTAMRYRVAHIWDVEANPRSRLPKKGKSPIGKVPIGTLSRRPSLIQGWLKGLSDRGLSDNYIRQIADLLSSIFVAAIDDGYVARNPVISKSVHVPAKPKAKARALTAAQAAVVAKSLGDDELFVWLSTGSGLREGECFGLGPDDVEFLGRERKIKVVRQVNIVVVPQDDGPSLRVPVFKPPKRGKEREIPLSDALSRKISRHLKAHPAREVTLPWITPDGPPRTAKLFFWREEGGTLPYTADHFRSRWGTARRKAKLPAGRQGGTQIGRHTFASVQLHGGVDIRKLAMWLGHEDPGFTLRVYTHFMPDTLDLGRKATDAFIEGPSALDVPPAKEGGAPVEVRP